MGGYQVQGHGSGDDGYDEEGYDESQRAEILEATRDGPTDGVVLTDLDPDTDAGFDDGEDPADELEMLDTERGAIDPAAAMDEEDLEEDDVQAALDDGDAPDETLDDADEAALRP